MSNGDPCPCGRGMLGHGCDNESQPVKYFLPVHVMPGTVEEARAILRAAGEKTFADGRREAFEEAAAICDRLEDEVPYYNEAGYFAYALRAAADKIRARMEEEKS